MSVPIALTIAGSDSGGGAGIQADLKTFAALGVYGASVVTALTAQNTKGVFAVHEAPAEFIAAQMDAVFSDLDVRAVKIGMLGSAAAIAAVGAGLRRHRARNVVLDTVMTASSGGKLLHDNAVDALRALIAQARLVTPNLPEAAILTGATQARDEEEMCAQAQKLLTLGVGAALIKGGHGSGSESVDILVEGASRTRFAAPRIETRNTHGTGCTLAAAIAAGLAKNLSLVDAVRQAKVFVTAALEAADRLEIGTGGGPVHHFHKWW
ncbi:MAG TPA: bifunctional hydroxymethylpyrimidine kinase/phosphomethylpyrimidine kinase [Xanthobacteraceae bacterium]|nr:bifunctional hydroxymethylpyrimidine kinase/phosphomethylpyrimidine kinase [Xanthobacteraceae bacterium]